MSHSHELYAEHPYHAAIGLPSTWQEVIETISYEVDHSTIKNCEEIIDFAHLMAYTDPSGYNVSFCNGISGESYDNITVRSNSTHTVAGWQPRPGLAHIDVLNEEYETQYRIFALVDDPHCYPVRQLDGEEYAIHQNYQISGIAVDISITPSLEEWEADNIDPSSDTPQIGANFIVSPWLFEYYGGTAKLDSLNSMAHVIATCTSVETVTNEVTGKQWYKVQANCGFDFTLAVPTDSSPAPTPDCVIQGAVMMTGTSGYWGE